MSERAGEREREREREGGREGERDRERETENCFIHTVQIVPSKVPQIRPANYLQVPIM